MGISFEHHQSAHCETGVTANLLSHYGIALTEAMAFGIGSGIFFGYLPFVRLNHLPLTAFRIRTGGIMGRVTKRLGVKLKKERFRRPDRAMAALDRKLAEGVPVGCRTGAYWLSYFPRRYRFHFNMHNIVVFDKVDGEYLISDPVFPDPVRCPAESLQRARFAKGPMPPKGHMYTVAAVPEAPDLAGASVAGLREVARTMLRAPGPFLGVRGIRHLARVVPRWPAKLGEDRATLYLGQMIRMQEEIGTGGGGFRFLFAAFLQEAGDLMGSDALHTLSARMTGAGDRWRDFAVAGSRICKGRASDGETYPALGDILRDCADQETAIYRDLDIALRNGLATAKG